MTDTPTLREVGDLSARILSAVEQAVADAHRGEWAYVLAATVRVTRDLDTAEEAVQDAYVQALRTWGRDGVPRRPAAWLTTVARRTALNLMRRRRTFEAKLPLLVEPDDSAPADAAAGDREAIPDDRLRLLFRLPSPPPSHQLPPRRGKRNTARRDAPSSLGRT